MKSGNGAPGRGGITRGRGDAPMVWGDESPGQSDQFEAKLLPRGRFPDPENSAILGVGSAAPKADATAEGAGLSDVEGSEGKTAWRRRLSPKHRRAVGSFFTERERKQK